MIAIASDKFKGTLSSVEAGEAIRRGLGDLAGKDIRIFAMADGGEGTAEALGAVLTPGGFYEYTDSDGSKSAYIPSCDEGLDWKKPPMQLRMRSSLEVGKAIRRAAGDGSYRRIDIGIGGTRTADGGLGMLIGMGYEIETDSDGLPTAIKDPANLTPTYRQRLRGLADVSAPLYASDSLSAMSFLAQKGAEAADVEWCAGLFRRLSQLYPSDDRHGGAGGGIGFALESIVGCPVTFGAPVILDKALNGLHPELIITGEGRVDSQTLGGKTVAAVYAYAADLGIPAATFCGSRSGASSLSNVFPCSKDGGPLPADPFAALSETARMAIPEIKKLLDHD